MTTPNQAILDDIQRDVRGTAAERRAFSTCAPSCGDRWSPGFCDPDCPNAPPGADLPEDRTLFDASDAGQDRRADKAYQIMEVFAFITLGSLLFSLLVKPEYASVFSGCAAISFVGMAWAGFRSALR